LSAHPLSSQRTRGFALLIVLWVLVLLGFIATQIVAAARTELRISGNLYSNAVAEAAAEGAINESIFWLCDPEPERAWRLGSVHELAIGHNRIVVRLMDEAARINPNLASPLEVEGLLRATGSNPATARQLAIGIAEWVGMALADHPPAATAAEYQAAGLDYVPPQQPMQSLDELGRVIGMTPAVLAAIRPHLTLYGPRVPDSADADPVVTMALTFARERTSGIRLTRPEGQRGGVVTARIVATAHGPGRAEVSRTAVVRFNRGMPQRWEILAWGPSVD
jgi:general secretion pathway protein K